jgi:hypothetical protein
MEYDGFIIARRNDKSPLEKRKQVGVDDGGFTGRHAVREALQVFSVPFSL